MGQYVSNRELDMPAVKAFMEIDTAQFTTRQRIVAPAIAALEKGEVIRCRLAN